MRFSGTSRTDTRVTADGDGRCPFTLTRGESLTLKAEEGHQPCVASYRFLTSSMPDVHVVEDVALLGANLPPALRPQVPAFPGRVYERTAQGQMPVAGVEVELGIDFAFASTLTDDDGRYMFCNATGGPVRASKPGYQTVIFTKVDPFDRLVGVDIELVRN